MEDLLQVSFLRFIYKSIYLFIFFFIFIMNIFIAKLSASTTSEDLKSLFEEYGEVTSAKVIFDKETGNSKKYGFVEMTNDTEAYSAIENLNECEYDNSQIVVKKARPKQSTGGGGGGGDRDRRSNSNNRFNKR